MAELADLRSVSSLLFWDQATMMPAGGAAARAHQVETLERVSHEKLTHPEVGRLLDELEPWASELDPDSIEARRLAVIRRDFEKAVRVPVDLAAQLAHAGASGEQAWMHARARSDFGLLRDALERHVELRHSYVGCFDGFEHPYDVLLDDFEPGLTLGELRPLLADLREELVPLVAQHRDAWDDGALRANFAGDRQKGFLLGITQRIGVDPEAWRLDEAEHPFAMSLAGRDVRLTTAYDPDDLSVALYSTLHEFGHGLYESQVAPELERTPLGQLVSLGLHESQSRTWENIIGRSRPFCEWLAPRLAEAFPEMPSGFDPRRLYTSVNAVAPSLIRIYADEATYNLHIVLRTSLEARMLEGMLEVRALPDAWNEGMVRLLGIEVPDDAHGVLQDIHWGAGLFGYFPTYTIGNLMSAQLWKALGADLPGVDDAIRAGEFGGIREWMRDNVHAHGRRYEPRELLRRVTGEPLRVAPLIEYLSAKLEDVSRAV